MQESIILNVYRGGGGGGGGGEMAKIYRKISIY